MGHAAKSGKQILLLALLTKAIVLLPLCSSNYCYQYCVVTLAKCFRDSRRPSNKNCRITKLAVEYALTLRCCYGPSSSFDRGVIFRMNNVHMEECIPYTSN
mmetsp:Transcript_19142/g.53312  ORF Transcript_19142/g.53312 Transcript_19142/m.53312 type:complete len:101 (-) Transcript_19142:1199-1501(-)